MAEIEELEGTPGQGAQGVEQGEQSQRQAQGGQREQASGSGQRENGQVQGGQEGPPQIPSRAQRLSTIQEPTIREYVQEIKAEMGAATKIIQNANYRLNSIVNLVPQISAALAARNNPRGPVIQSLVNQTLSLLKGVDDIVSKLDDSYISVNVTLDTLEAYEVSDLFNAASFNPIPTGPEGDF